MPKNGQGESYRKTNWDIIMSMRRSSAGGPKKCCTGCGKEKPLTRFYRNPKTRDGRESRCVACKRAASHKRRGEEGRW